MRFVSPARLLAALSIGLLLGGCGVIPHYDESSEQAEQTGQAGQAGMETQPVQQADVQPGASNAPGADAQIEKIPFRVGVSTATVEKLARAHACTGGPGAGLITPPGPVEVYRMACDGGKVFMARCELRQCKAM
jgi:hypothetical protein